VRFSSSLENSFDVTTSDLPLTSVESIVFRWLNISRPVALRACSQWLRIIDGISMYSIYTVRLERVGYQLMQVYKDGFLFGDLSCRAAMKGSREIVFTPVFSCM